MPTKLKLHGFLVLCLLIVGGRATAETAYDRASRAFKERPLKVVYAHTVKNRGFKLPSWRDIPTLSEEQNERNREAIAKESARVEKGFVEEAVVTAFSNGSTTRFRRVMTRKKYGQEDWIEMKSARDDFGRTGEEANYGSYVDGEVEGAKVKQVPTFSHTVGTPYAPYALAGVHWKSLFEPGHVKGEKDGKLLLERKSFTGSDAVVKAEVEIKTGRLLSITQQAGERPQFRVACEWDNNRSVPAKVVMEMLDGLGNEKERRTFERASVGTLSETERKELESFAPTGATVVQFGGPPDASAKPQAADRLVWPAIGGAVLMACGAAAWLVLRKRRSFVHYVRGKV
ncbi:MAG: hypothetical protein KIT11_02445 [Fimbriimonadaceae bacterium]|nr:hypothetical protein [Fimbriimonadaceae bacterium]QYK54773.1 MAG: hypothetical protein KF733_07090 [Fimbriimonadaceae bacterium]